MTISAFDITEPFASGYLQVGNNHEIYYTQAGNAQGLPVVILHGGPGGGSEAKHRQPFDPNTYHIIQFDQRGCGQSRPWGELSHNTTTELVEDIEKLREHLGLEKWVVAGSSWGSALALAYAQAYSNQVVHLLLRGVFLARAHDITWLTDPRGVARIFPEKYQKFINFLPDEARENIVGAHLKRLVNGDEAMQREAALNFMSWEGDLCKMEWRLLEAQAEQSKDEEPPYDFLVNMAKILCHYMSNNCFLSQNQLLKHTDKIKHIPATLIHGRYDMVCPYDNAWALHQALPSSKLITVPDAGHSGSEMLVQMCQAAQDIAQQHKI